jgi:2-dehydro-3-deoxyphosphogluconate aldolase/(4S)-4-hydroxy-2-oxoglutarate aldolase
MPMDALFRGVGVIPVLTIESEAQALPLARALAEGGLRVIEVTLRTKAAVAAIAAIARELPELVVGAGTVLHEADVAAAKDAGARFLVSPGLRGKLARTARTAALPYLPGVVTPSEIMRAADLGLDFLKFFPAEAIGGIALLRSLLPVFPGIRFCPTGGIDEVKARDYLALANVPVVGGSWMAPREAVAAGDWPRIRRLAERAHALGSAPAA